MVTDLSEFSTQINFPDCPFCKSGEHLEIISYHTEKYDGDAVECAQCDAIVPIEAWLKLVKKPVPAAGRGANYCDKHGGFGFQSDCVECKELLGAT